MNPASIEFASQGLSALAWSQLWQVTLVAILVGLAVRLACRRRPHLAYLLWMLVVVKALTPPLVASPTSLFSWALRTPQAVASPLQTIIQGAPPNDRAPDFSHALLESAAVAASAEPVVAPIVEPAAPLSRITLARMAIVVWASGMLVLAAFVTVKWIVFRRRWHGSASETPEWLTARVQSLATELQLRVGVRNRLRLLISRNAESPAVFGICRPTVLLPASLVERGEEVLSLDALTPILAHELIHVRRGDPAAALLQLAAQLVWWFHPLIWWANRETRRERERACDEEVVVGLGCRPRDYARVLLDVLEAQVSRPPAFVVPGVGMLGVTAKRLDHLLHSEHFHRRTPRWCYAVALVMLAMVVPGAGLSVNAAPDDTAPGKPSAVVFTGSLAESRQGTAPAATTAEPDKNLARLKELGAIVSEGRGPQGAVHWWVSFDKSWKGTDAQMRLVDDVADLSSLHFDLSAISPQAISQVRPARQVRNLTLLRVTDATIAKVDHLPDCEMLTIADSSLDETGARRLAELVPAIEHLHVNGMVQDAQNDQKKLGITDDGLKGIAELRKLDSLTLAKTHVSDAGLKHLAPLKSLKTLQLLDDDNIRGPGLADLAALPALRTLLINSPLDKEGLRAVAQLQQLQVLMINPGAAQPNDVEILAQLANLQMFRSQRDSPPEDAPDDVALGNALLRTAAKMPQVRVIELSQIAADDAGLAAIANVTALRALSLHPFRTTDHSLEIVAGLRNLTTLDLSGDGAVSDQGLAHMAKLAKLKQFTLPLQEVTDRGLAHLAPLVNVIDLNLADSKVTGTGLSALKELKQLKSLSLDQTPFNDQGAKALPALPQLQTLKLNATKITDTALADVAKLGQLTELECMNTAVTDAGIKQLTGLKSLQRLMIANSKVSEAGTAALEAAIPGLEVNLEIYGLLVTSAALKYVNDGDGEPDAPAEKKEPETKDTKANDDPDAGPTKSDQSLERLKELGARVGEERDAKGQRHSVVAFVKGWQGTSADMRLLDHIPDLGSIHIDLREISPAAVSELRPERRLDHLALIGLSDATLAKVARLPDCRGLTLPESSLSDDGAKRLVQLAPGVEKLLIDGDFHGSPDGRKMLGITDAGLKYIAELRKLDSLSLTRSQISDAGLKNLVGIKSLTTLQIFDCEQIRGPGLATLATLPALRNLQLNLPLDAENLRAIAQLRQLENLMIDPGTAQPGDIDSLAQLSNLRMFQVSRNTSIEEARKDIGLGNALLRTAARIPALRFVGLSQIAADDAGLEAMANATALRELSLYPFRTTDRSLELVSGLTNLTMLNLSGDGAVSDQGLAHLARLVKLKQFSLPLQNVTDRGLAQLSTLTSLVELNLFGSKVTGSGLEGLNDLKQVTTLSLDNTPFDDQGAKALLAFPRLKDLNVNSTKITDAGLADIAQLSHLGNLNLMHTAVTDAGLKKLAGLKELRLVSIANTKVSKAGGAALEQAIPGLRVRSEDIDWVLSNSYLKFVDDSPESPAEAK